MTLSVATPPAPFPLGNHLAMVEKVEPLFGPPRSPLVLMLVSVRTRESVRGARYPILPRGILKPWTT